MSKHKFMYRCLCGNEFQMGPQIYNGKYIRRYDITVCKTCWAGNWDGWVPHYEKDLIEHLNKKGLTIPERNAKGLLPRE